MPKRIDPSKIGKKGGRARAEALSPHERSEVARKAASTRWAKQYEGQDLPKALCESIQPLRLGDVEIQAYVLEEGYVDRDEDRRVIRIDGFQRALGMQRAGGETRLVDFGRRIATNPEAAHDLPARLSAPIVFIPPNGGVAKGYSASLLVDICDMLLEARQSGGLTPRYHRIADAAEVVMRAFANVGVVALIDENTGYQEVRKRLALAEILDRYLDDNLNQWTKTFPDEFYEQFFRLKGWDYENLKAGDIKPSEVGRFTKAEVYRRLHPGIIRELEERNPFVAPGRRRQKHHQWLSREIGHPALERHIHVIIAIMRLSEDWLHFEDQLQRALPAAADTAFLGFMDRKGRDRLRLCGWHSDG